MQRVKPIYLKKVKIYKKLRGIFWNCPNIETYLEKFILRVLLYGNFDEIKEVYKNYPEETFDIAFRYP